MVFATGVNSSEQLKESSLEAIGYICQDIVRIPLSLSLSLSLSSLTISFLTQES
jgi:hypothetical protein